VLERGEGGKEIQFLPPRMQYFNPDRSALIQVGTDQLTVNHLKPYPTWEEFKPMILKNLDTYNKEANPKGFKRIGLRYINIININKTLESLKDYLNYYPTVPSELSESSKSFNIKVDMPYNDERDRLILSLATVVPENPDTFSFVLDVDYSMSKPESVSFEQIPDWLESAHSAIEKAFEASITDKCRELFK
jgi:uncharacterized protein (TIGR04255 family)